MNGLQCARNELKRLWSSRFTRIALIAVALMPLLYSSLYLWAFWDPYKNLNQLPVAVVNNDKGTTYDGKKLEVGKELVDTLKDDKELDWHFVSDDEARKGLKDQKYYIVIRIPENFSEQAASVKNQSPVKPVIEYIPKESRNMLAAQLGERVIEQLKTKLSEKLTKEYLDTMTSSLEDVQLGFNKAADAAKQLSDGTNEAQRGANDLKDGINKAKDGVVELAKGLPVLADGAKQISFGLAQTASGNQQIAAGLNQAKNGLSQLKEKSPVILTGLADLSGGLGQIQKEGTRPLVTGSQQVSKGLSQLQTGTSQLYEGSKQVTTGMKNIQMSIDQLKLAIDQGLPASEIKNQLDLISQGMNPLIEGQKNVEMGLADVNSKLPDLINGQQQVAGGLVVVDQKIGEAQAGASQLETGFSQYAAGIDQLYTGVSEAQAGVQTISQAEGKMATASIDWMNGANKAAKGSLSLKDGLGQLSDGSSQLASGLVDIKDGANTLSLKLKDGATEIQDQKPTSSQLEQMASPLEIKTEIIDPVPNYGTGFAPYFISLALWVGALILFFVIDVHAIDQVPMRTSSWVLGKYLPLVIVGTIQAVISSAVLQFILGLDPAHPILFYLYNILLSMTFIAVIQGLVSILGDAGRFLAIVLLMLQLTSSAGTFPLELTPKFFQNISPYLPMTYSVKGLKEIISAGDTSIILHTVFVLLFIAVGAFITTVILSKGKIAHLQQERQNATPVNI
ncbi:YhgE/Pip domain-containing protein [Tepidibacillus fermentans]|uniref:Putative membrane protein n=1 Tax=Tepidibacillus fermentans TaxID=1281767 RepID=A0A4R3K585_9BACI|nr:YhgE/Pip domain-containing protein [Tepidibacillus fermentans]TCS77946.1 putative membrane protein [Tepidibacillus fermentans]